MRNENMIEPQKPQCVQSSVIASLRILKTESIEFICICPSGLKYTKSHKEEMKEWRKIGMNYLKIERLYKNINE